jgi:glycosyltransferase involved in cell wall biosynthesis
MPPVSKRIGVDLTPLRRGGANGGVKPLIIQSLKTTGNLLAEKANWVYFTNSESHAEVRLLARMGDELVCVQTMPGSAIPKRSAQPFVEINESLQDPLLLLKNRIDVLYCPFGATHLACPGIATVSCIVDVLHLDFPASLSPEEIKHRESYFNETIKVSDALNCISRYVTARVKELYPDYAGQFFHTYNTIQNRFFNTAATPAIKTPTTPYFFYPANFWLHKNHEVLIIAYLMYCTSVGQDAWPLVLTGHPDSRMDEIKKVVESLGVSEKITFLGHVTESELKSIWDGCGALVFPSLHEGFGIPLLEAMFFGKPIICSNATCLPEIGGNACFFIDPRKPAELSNALVSLHQDEGLRIELSLKSTARLHDFNFESEMLKLSDILYTVKASRIWHKHITPDGNFLPQALISIPCQSGRWKLGLELFAQIQATAVAIKAGELPLGTHRLKFRQNERICFWILNPKGCLHLSLVNPEKYGAAEVETDKNVQLVKAWIENEEGGFITLFKLHNEI